MAVEPGPSTTTKMPSVVRSWKRFRSILASSPRTTTQSSPLTSANRKSLRVSRMREQLAGISRVVLCRKAKPLTVMLLESLRTKPRSPCSTAPPRDCETMVIGASTVPFRPATLMEPPDGTVYVPSATTMRSPGTARSTAA